MLASKRGAQSGSAYIVYVNPQTQKEKTVEICSDIHEFTIGRGTGCDLVVSNPVISRKHCIMKHDEKGDWIIFDKSSSGTFLNRELIGSGVSRSLNNNDTVTLSGPFNYPFYFYIGDGFMKKKRKLATSTPACSNRTIKDGKENSITSRSVISLSSEDDDQSVCVINSDVVVSGLKKNDDGKDDSCAKKKLRVNNEDNIVMEEDKVEENMIAHLRMNLKLLLDEKTKLKEEALRDAEEFSKQVENLKIELQVVECRQQLNCETIDNLKIELNDVKKMLLEKDNDLKMTEARLYVAEQREALQMEEMKTEVMLKVNEDIMELLENELQCSICNEIIIEAAVLNCTHVFCYFCINTWMKKKKECAVCRTQIKDLVKARALDSFIDKVLQKYSTLDSSEHRQQMVEDRKKEKTLAPAGRPQRNQRQPRNARAVRGADQVAARNVPPHPAFGINVAAFPQPPQHIFRMINRYIPEAEQLADDLNLIDNDLMNELLPIVNLANDAIDLRINRHRRRSRRGQPAVRVQPREINIIDLRDSPDRH